MKRLNILLFFVLFYVGITFGQQKVAVYVTKGQDAGIDKVLGDQLVAAFAKSGKYIAIERTSSFLAELNKEQGYQRTGAVDDNDISRLGKQFGVQLVCVAEVNDVFGEKYVSARLIDVESAQVVNTASEGSAMKSMDDLLKVTQDITTELTGKTAKDKADDEAAKAKAETEKEAEKAKAKEAGYYIMDNLAVSTGITGEVDFDTAQSMAKTSAIGGYKDWQLPEIGELALIYTKRKEIWRTDDNWNSAVWSNTKDINCNSMDTHKCIRWDGNISIRGGGNGCRFTEGYFAKVLLVRDIE